MKIQDIPKLNPTIWKQTGEFALGRIREDSNKGKPQSGSKRSYKTASEGYSYKDYKKNGMRKFGIGPDKVGAGQRLKGFEGISTNRETGKVNARLTGETLRRITVKSTKNYAELNYQRGSVVMGLQDQSYNIQDLSDKNISRVTKKISDFIGKNITKYTQKDTVIKVGKR